MPSVVMPVGEDRNVRAEYLECLQRHGISYRTVPPEDGVRPLAHAQGLFLTGGSDVEPRRYGCVPYGPPAAYDFSRDWLELSLLDYALSSGMPILAICRGAEVLAVHRGHRLVQHIPAALGTCHSREPVPKTVEALTTTRISLCQGSRLAGIYGTDSIEVRCAHHQAALPCEGSPLSPAAYAEDGIVEAWEMEEGFRVAVQYHPEFDQHLHAPLFAAFRNAM